jgi:tRNA threonylcarbamoyl adenosine modification protein (Sua5/YciO/YrdC/YwlC family)
MIERITIHSEHPSRRALLKAEQVLNDGGLVIYPTDTVYGLGCDLFNKKAVEKIYSIKGKNKKKLLSFICPDLKDIAQYAHVSTPAYKIMRHLLPGPYTFILEATKQVPRILLERRKTVGIRVPANTVCQELLSHLGNPIISTSASLSDMPYMNEPDLIEETFRHRADLFLDNGVGGMEPSTVIDLTTEEPEVLRLGKGPVI